MIYRQYYGLVRSIFHVNLNFCLLLPFQVKQLNIVWTRDIIHILPISKLGLRTIEHFANMLLQLQLQIGPVPTSNSSISMLLVRVQQSKTPPSRSFSAVVWNGFCVAPSSMCHFAHRCSWCSSNHRAFKYSQGKKQVATKSPGPETLKHQNHH